MSIADPHCHTTASDGLVSARELVAAAAAAGIDLIAVTDHDTMASVAEAQACGLESNVAVVAGQEITTRWPAQTHVVGWFLEKPIRAGMSVEDTVDAIHAQGGLAIIPHPFMPTYFASMQPGMLHRLLETRAVDGIELVFTAPLGARRRGALGEFYSANKERLGAAIGGSDCHFGVYDMATAVTEYEGDFRAAVAASATRPQRLRAARIPARVAVRQQWRSLVQLPLRRLRGDL
jgi:hypothetical protein